MEAWYMNDSEKEDYRLPRHCEPKEFVSLEKLEGFFFFQFEKIIILLSFLDYKMLCQFIGLMKLAIVHVYFAELGVLTWRVDADNYENDENVKQIRESGGYSSGVSF